MMEILKTPARWPIAVVLAAGVTVAIAGAGLRAQGDAGQTETTPEQVDRLIQQLGDEDYFVRQRAQEELARLSFEAFEAVSAATTHEDLEIAARAKYLLGLMRVQWVAEGDPTEVKGLLSGYRLLSTTAKLARMHALAELPDRMGLPALCRLIRYEMPVLSKHAAAELLAAQPRDEPPNKELAELVQEKLGHSRRPGARWLLTWLRFHDDAEAAVADWAKLVEAEYSLLGRSPTQTAPRIVAKLVRVQVRWLNRLDRKDQALAAVHRLIDLETGRNPETLTELLNWLVQQQAWDGVDKLAARFPAQFAKNPILLYGAAQAQAEQGHADRAEQTAQRARNLNAGGGLPQLARHYVVARALWHRGLFRWAQQEYRHVIDTGAAGSDIVLAAHSSLAEMFHDHAKDLQAAELLRELVQNAQRQPGLTTRARHRLPALRSRMNYFFACHFGQKEDRAKQREYLEKATEGELADVDALIARYRLPDQAVEFRKRTLELIHRETARFRQEIAQDPGNPTACNQFAWLVANTEGDLDAALGYSIKSVQLRPTSGSFHDTLAHVYFAKRDYERAVKTQAKAAELDPHSRQIARQLKRFREKLQETKKKEDEP